MKLKRLLITAIVLSLNACSFLLPPKQVTPQWLTQAQYHRLFNSEGRLSVNMNGKGYSAHFSWQKQNATEVLAVSTPLGSTVGQICQDRRGLIAVAGKETYTASSVTELSQQLMGFDLPLEYLSYWAQGVIVPDQAHHIDKEGRLQQMGWQISRTALAADPSKSRRVELTRKDMAIKIVFDDFEFSTTTSENDNALCEIRTQETP